MSLYQLQEIHSRPVSLSGPEKVVEVEEVSKLDSLDQLCRKTVDVLSTLQAAHAIRVYESEDGLRAGIVCGPSFKKEHQEICKRVSNTDSCSTSSPTMIVIKTFNRFKAKNSCCV